MATSRISARYSPRTAAERRGTSLLELMIVVIIISLLAVTVVHYYNQNLEGARRTRLLSDIDQIKIACKKFAISSQGIYPDRIEQLEGAYFKKIPQSPYGTSYQLDAAKGEVFCVYYENNARKEVRVRYRPE